jgi:hypothetical protein
MKQRLIIKITRHVILINSIFCFMTPPKVARLKKLLPGLYVERMTADEVTAR